MRMTSTWPQVTNRTRYHPTPSFTHPYPSLAPSTKIAMPPRKPQETSTESLLPPILALLTQTPPNPYSAHQKALTTTARLVKSDHALVAIDILHATSRELLKLGEAGSGVELGVRMIQVMGDAGVLAGETQIGAVVYTLYA